MLYGIGSKIPSKSRFPRVSMMPIAEVISSELTVILRLAIAVGSFAFRTCSASITPILREKMPLFKDAAGTFPVDGYEDIGKIDPDSFLHPAPRGRRPAGSSYEGLGQGLADYVRGALSGQST